ncbi:MAG: arginine--tRNA ligase [Candidatus Shapirobacteria bacterium]|nr:arginine--tRNA ligase [Candidatus Shapirobacteria bacterium]MDD4410621.1 arginine--tRNA ligase [Candidatus Shapirobacteria bacterium]
MKIVEDLKKIIIDAGKKLDLQIVESDIKIEHPAAVNFGDYSTNIAMILAKKDKINPRELANSVCQSIRLSNNQLLEKVEVAGAGFINFYLKPEFLIKEAEEINYEIEFRNKLSENGNGKIMVIDYSAPNIAKPFGIGHLRSTDIGQAIYNIYKILGWNCIGDNHIGDWGTQYGKLVAAIKKWNEKDLDELTIEDLEKLYVKFHKEAETDEKLIDEGREWFAKLEKGDSEARKIWQKCIDISLIEFEKVYELLGVHIDFIHGESFYEDKLEEVTKEIIKKGITKKSEGAVIVEFEKMPPAMLQKSNGTTTYFTRDMATIKYRLENWNPNLIIYEVGVDQELHFRQVFETAKLMGWMPDQGMIHIAHGLIRWTTGKFSTRKGDTIHLSEVIDKAMEKASEIANKSVVDKNLTATEKEEMIKAVAIGAIKFNDLASDPRKDVIFDWDQIMSLDGDSGPYLQYTYARCKSVLNKSKDKEQKNISEVPQNINNDEMALLKEFYKFEEKIIEASQRYSPAVIAEYLLSVARKYNEFYAKNRIIDQKEENFRIFLTRTTASVIDTGLNLLGIETIEKM